MTFLNGFHKIQKLLQRKSKTWELEIQCSQAEEKQNFYLHWHLGKETRRHSCHYKLQPKKSHVERHTNILMEIDISLGKEQEEEENDDQSS